MLPYALSIVALVSLTFPVGAGGSPQNQTQPGPAVATSQRPYVFRASSRLVQVSVIVHDSKGAPIIGLKKEDFALLDAGKPQEIAFFSATAPAYTVPRSLPTNVFTNRFDLKGQDPGATIVILFDSLNTSFEDQSRARQHILRFLQTVKPQDRIAIFALTTELLPLHNFSEDVASLQDSVNRFSPRLLAAFDASHPDPFHVPALASDPFWKVFEDHVNNANGEIADSQVINRLGITYAAVLNVAEYVENIPGHKSLVWVSGGIPIQLGNGHIGIPDRDNFSFESAGVAGANGLSGLAQVLNRVDMAIYPVDARGIDLDDSAAGFFTRQDQRDTFRLLADGTGGRAFYGSNDIAHSIQAAVDDDRYSYTLGYYPDHGVWDGKFREIKISSSVAGSRLRYRQGYFAFPRRPESEVGVATDLQQAARSPLDATALGVSVNAKALPSSSARVLQLQVILDPNQFLLRDEDTRRKGGLDLLFLQKDSAGKFLAAEKQHFDVNFDHREYVSLAQTGLVLQRRLSINPNSAEIRVLVRDAGSGALGSVTIPAKGFF